MLECPEDNESTPRDYGMLIIITELYVIMEVLWGHYILLQVGTLFQEISNFC